MVRLCLDVAGACDKPCSRKSRRFGDFYEVRLQLAYGPSNRTAHAAVAVPCAFMWHCWGHLLYDRYNKLTW